MMRVLILALFTGCLPAGSVQATRGIRTIDAPIVTRAFPIRFDTTSASGVILVQAIWPRECRRDVYDRVPDGAAERSFLSGAARRSQRELVHTIRRSCGIAAAGTPIVVTFGSGRTLAATTDRNGALLLVLPDNERAEDVRFAAPEAKQPLLSRVTLPDAAPAPVGQGMAGVRDVALRCARRLGIQGTVQLHLSIKTGTVTGEPEPMREDFAACIDRGLRDVTFPRSKNMQIKIPFTVSKPSIDR